MASENKTTSFRLMLLINAKKLTLKAMQVFDDENIPIHFQFTAHGTAKSDMLDIIGLGGLEKDVLTAVLPKKAADELMKKLYNELELFQKNSGIVCSVPLSAISSIFMKFSEKIELSNERSTENKEMKTMSDTKFSVIAATVNLGYSEEVMNAARNAGARGGTVFHNNCIINEEALSLWGNDFNEEKETVLIIANNEKKLDIMKSITNSCGMATEAKGIVFSLPIDNIMGINS